MNTEVDVPKVLVEFTETLKANCKPSSTGYCARYVRIALESAFKRNDFKRPPSFAACDYGEGVLDFGFNMLSETPSNNLLGDVRIYSATEKHQYGHMQAYIGNNTWACDFIQETEHVADGNFVTYRFSG